MTLARAASQLDRGTVHAFQNGLQLCLPASCQTHTIAKALILKPIKIMSLFSGLRRIREFEKGQLPFLKSFVDFDILIEIGYAEEQHQPLTLKQLFLLDITSRSTVRRKLTKLIEEGVVVRRKHARDQRATVLTISSSSIKLLTKYCGVLSSICTLNFK